MWCKTLSFSKCFALRKKSKKTLNKKLKNEREERERKDPHKYRL